MSDIDFYGAKPGDVCNRQGDIRGIDDNGNAIIVKTGVVEVGTDQAVRAKPYGWEIASIAVAGMVAIKR